MMMSAGKLRRHMKTAHRRYVEQQAHPTYTPKQQAAYDRAYNERYQAIRTAHRNLTERTAP